MIEAFIYNDKSTLDLELIKNGYIIFGYDFICMSKNEYYLINKFLKYNKSFKIFELI